MVHRALIAFAESDLDTVRQIHPGDDMIDGLYNQVFKELITFMITDPSTIDRTNYQLWAAHNLERAADSVINICELVIYFATGQIEEIKVSNDKKMEVDLI